MIGIDLGTTNSLVALLKDGVSVVIPNELGEMLTPSAVAISESGETLVGRPARDRLITDPSAGRMFFKRDMGLEQTYQFGDRDWSPIECSALILREMKRIAEVHLGEAVDAAVITVPAYFRDEQRQATLNAAKIAGIKVERIINEPTAAALTYGYRQVEDCQIMVFDLGGGTFDVTILEIFDGIIEVKASGGESRLGGEDFTDALMQHILTETGFELTAALKNQFRHKVEQAKRELSHQDSICFEFESIEFEITRAGFEQLCSGLLSRIVPIITRCLRDANLTAQEIDDVLLVGGGSRTHGIAELLVKHMQRIPKQQYDLDKVVAMGAAIQSGLFNRNEAVEDLVLTDVCPHSLGIETSRHWMQGGNDGYFEPLIDRNTTIPVSRSKEFTTLHPDQDEVKIKIYQGESRMTEDNQSIGTLSVKGLRHRPDEDDGGVIDIRFTYDMNGILEVEVVKRQNNEKVNKIFVQRPGEMSEAEIEEAMARLQPLKIHPRERLTSRARIERASRLFTQLIGTQRENLELYIQQFEHALEEQDEERIGQTGAVLDSYMNPYFASENEPARP